MITAKQCLKKYGPPEREGWMVLWDVPSELEISAVPKKIYCNKDLVLPLEQAFRNIKERKKAWELKTWDGCFNIRNKKRSTSLSLHSWGVAVDINAAWNKMGTSPTLSKELVMCFMDAGFDWGGRWAVPDGMHFQLSSI